MRYQLSAWILLVVFLFNSIGYGIFFRLEQIALHEKAEKLAALSLPEEALHVITVTPLQSENLDWQRTGKELIEGGRLYDIVRTEKANGLIRFYCVDDDMETGLMTVQLHAKSKNENSAIPFDGIAAQLLKLALSSQFVPPGSLPFTRESSEPIALPAVSSFYSFSFCSEDVPPPRAAVV